MLWWWFDMPHGWNEFVGFTAFCAGAGALGTLLRFLVRYRKRQAMQAVPTMPAWTPPFEATGNIAPVIEVEYKRLPN
jgi:hypothetical protein